MEEQTSREQESVLTQEQENEQFQIRCDKLKALQDAGQDPFRNTTFSVSHESVDVLEHAEELIDQNVSMAGRMISRRIMGKASFAHILDAKGRIQIYVRREDVGEESYAQFKKDDIGDIFGFTGKVFRTKTGEISIHVDSITLLTKSLRPLPEKFHGLKDTELRYRQRSVDLIVNPEVRDIFRKRRLIISTIRRLMDADGFIEVETPVLNSTASGASARPFITHHNTLDIDMYMRIATELHLKMCVVGGLERVYEIGRLFRNEGMDPMHNPEFTTIEAYQAYTDYHGMMRLAEKLFSECSLKVNGTTRIVYQGQEIDLTPPFAVKTMNEAVREQTGVDFYGCADDAEAREHAKKLGIEIKDQTATKGKMLAEAFDAFVEEKLIQPTFIVDYPVEISPLSKRSPKNPAITERFELFIAGHEYANAFSELNDPVDQRGRFIQQAMERAKGDDEAMMIDENFCTALEYGMPPTGGIGIGIDRMVMLLTDASSIRDVLLFPTMKPIKTENKGTGVKAEAENAEPEAAPAVNPKDPSMPLFDAKVPDYEHLNIEPLFQDQVDFETFSKSDFRAVKVLECEAVPKSKKLLKFTLDDGSGEKRTILSGIHAFYEPEELIGKTCIAITNLPPRAMMGIESCGMLISAVHKEGEEEKLHLLMIDPHVPAGAKLY